MIGGCEVVEYVKRHTGADACGETAMDPVKTLKNEKGG
jgi:methanogenic corrinoid protein MtbC1